MTRKAAPSLMPELIKQLLTPAAKPVTASETELAEQEAELLELLDKYIPTTAQALAEETGYAVRRTTSALIRLERRVKAMRLAPERGSKAARWIKI